MTDNFASDYRAKTLPMTGDVAVASRTSSTARWPIAWRILFLMGAAIAAWFLVLSMARWI